MNDRITPHVSISDEERRNHFVRDAVARAAIARAQREAKPWVVTDEELEAELVKVSAADLEALNEVTYDPQAFRRKLLAGFEQISTYRPRGFRQDYLPEELEL